MAGKLHREGRPIAVRHVAEVLAGDDAGIGAPHRRAKTAAMQHATSHAFKDNAQRALGDAAAAAGDSAM